MNDGCNIEINSKTIFVWRTISNKFEKSTISNIDKKSQPRLDTPHTHTHHSTAILGYIEIICNKI